MLEYLKIKNIALIDELEVSFGPGLNVLSGETGAGKSIIIDSINFVLGERAGRDFIRNGETQAAVEALLCVTDDEISCGFNEMGIELDDDSSILLFRSINGDGKNVCRINGKTVTIGMMKELSALLVDVHGQHEHQSLLNSGRHIELLDRFCGSGLSELLNRLAAKLKSYKENAKEINTISGGESEREYKIDLYTYQIKEIETANLQKGEDEALAERKKLLNNSEKLITASNSALSLLYGGESDEMSAVDKISKALEYINFIASLDETQQPAAECINNVYAQLDDLIRDFRKYCESLEHDPREIDEIESRLDLIYRLKKKYGHSIAEIIEFYENTKEKLFLIENSEERLEELKAEKQKLEKEITSVCEDISELRKGAAAKIRTEIETILKDLGMNDAKFEISIDKKESFTATGFDNVEFLISPNKGEPVKPLSKIASGGEMSRVMLALKTALADFDNIDTFIFDEIDAGVSGRTAQQVAEKLSAISKSHQILCITHLPQIAAMGDSNYLIEKKSEADKTNTTIVKLDYEDCIKELARLIGGAKITQTTLDAAKEMKEFAIKIKQ